MKSIVLIGASGHAKVIIDILDSQGLAPDYLVDSDESRAYLLGFRVHRDYDSYDRVIISIGNNEIRKRIVSQIKVNEYLSVIAQSAIVSKYATIGEGSVVMQGAIVQSCAKIGSHCIINTGAVVDHDCLIGNFAHISPNATLCGNVAIGEGAWIGAGAVVKQGVKIGSWAIVGAGAVVIDDIPDSVIAVGNKCKVVKIR